MKKDDIIRISTDIVNDIITDSDIVLVDIEYVKEGPFKYLRIYIDKNEDSIGVDDCENISREFNDRIDQIDFIDEQYYLEVSTPGIDRPFKTEQDYIDNIGKNVEVSLYKNIRLDKKINIKWFTAELISKEENVLKLNIKIKNKNYAIDINTNDIAKINRAVEFNKEENIE